MAIPGGGAGILGPAAVGLGFRAPATFVAAAALSFFPLVVSSNAAPNVATAMPTQATSFAAPAPAAQTPSGWQGQNANAAKLAQAAPTQATTFRSPAPPDNNTTSKGWFQPLGVAVPVAKAQPGSTFVPFNTPQLVTTPQGWQSIASAAPVRAVVNGSALTFVVPPFDVPRGWEGRLSVAPSAARIAASSLVGPLGPPQGTPTPSVLGWQSSTQPRVTIATASPTQATQFQAPAASGTPTPSILGWQSETKPRVTHAIAQPTQATSFQSPYSAPGTPTPAQFGWYAPLSASAPVAKARPGWTFVPFNTAQVAIGPTTQTVPIYQDSGVPSPAPVYYQSRFGPVYVAPVSNTTTSGWFQPLSVAVPVAKAQQGIAPTFVALPFPTVSVAWQQPLSRPVAVAQAQPGHSFVPLNTAQVVPAPPPNGWFGPPALAPKVAVAWQGWTFVPFDTVQIAPPPPVVGSGGGGLGLRQPGGQGISRKRWRELKEEQARERAAILAEHKRELDEKAAAKSKAEAKRVAGLVARQRADDDKTALVRLEARAAEAEKIAEYRVAIDLNDDEEEELIMLLLALDV